MFCSNVVQIKMLYKGIHRHFKFYNRVIFINVYLLKSIRNKNEVWEDYTGGFRTLLCFQKCFTLDFTVFRRLSCKCYNMVNYQNNGHTI